MNEYTFRITTEGIGTDESIQSNDILLSAPTPHEAWVTMGALLAGIEEHDRVILKIELL